MLWVAGTITLALAACVCSSTSQSAAKTAALAMPVAQGFSLEAATLRADLAVMTQAPHPFGSPRQAVIATFIATRLEQSGLKTWREDFSAEVPNPAALVAKGPTAASFRRQGTNIYGFGANLATAPCAVALASHYDTKTVLGTEYVGANDSASSTVVLLQQMSYLESLSRNVSATGKPPNAAMTQPACAIFAIFFDGEEAVLPNWTDGEGFSPARQTDHTYGSRYAAAHLRACTYQNKAAQCLGPELGNVPLLGLILMDMIGSPGIQISRDRYSTPALAGIAALGARTLGNPAGYDSRATPVEDDHIAYLERAVPALDLIDFNHTAYWHTQGDDAARLSSESLAFAGRLALFVATVTAAP